MPDPYWEAVGEKIARRRQGARKRRAGQRDAARAKVNRMACFIGKRCCSCGGILVRDVIPNPSSTGSFFCTEACYNAWRTYKETRLIDRESHERQEVESVYSHRLGLRISREAAEVERKINEEDRIQ